MPFETQLGMACAVMAYIAMVYTVVAYVVMAYIVLTYTIRRRGGIPVEHLHDLTYGYGRWRSLQQQQIPFGHMRSHNMLVITAGWRLP